MPPKKKKPITKSITRKGCEFAVLTTFQHQNYVKDDIGRSSLLHANKDKNTQEDNKLCIFLTSPLPEADTSKTVIQLILLS
jgi:hypothetical protein